MSNKKFKGINPLQQQQIKKLEAIGFDDLNRKIDELVREFNKLNKTEEPKKFKAWVGKLPNTYGICDCPAPCKLHKKEYDEDCYNCGDMVKCLDKSENDYEYFEKKAVQKYKDKLLRKIHNSEMDGEEVSQIIDLIKNI